MISFEGFVLEDSGPVYLQIMRYIRQGIAAGAIGDREEVPSRRALSALLGVNPNIRTGIQGVIILVSVILTVARGAKVISK